MTGVVEARTELLASGLLEQMGISLFLISLQLFLVAFALVILFTCQQ